MRKLFISLGLFLFLVLGTAWAQERILPEMTLTIGSQKVTAEIAISDSDRQKGLMHRTHMDKNHGMLFIFQEPRVVSFWMKNTKIPLDLGFIDREGKLVGIKTMAVPVPGEKLKHYGSDVPVRYALEVNAGWFKEKGIEPGIIIPELVPKKK